MVALWAVPSALTTSCLAPLQWKRLQWTRNIACCSKLATKRRTALSRCELLDRDLGIFIGIMNTDYVARGEHQRAVRRHRHSGAPLMGGDGGVCARHRTAMRNWHTAASALVALDSGVLSLRSRSSVRRPGGAANLMLGSHVSLLFAQAGMLSVDTACSSALATRAPRGRCATSARQPSCWMLLRAILKASSLPPACSQLTARAQASIGAQTATCAGAHDWRGDRDGGRPTMARDSRRSAPGSASGRTPTR